MKYLITFLLLLSSFCVLSQANYHKGSITNNSGQTTQGYINLREWEENPKYIEFKNNLDDKSPQQFFPSSIKSFVVDSIEQYYSYSGRISLDAVELPNLPDGLDTTSKNDIVFLKLVTTGDKVSMYAYTDSIKTRYFVQEKQDLPFELSYRQYYDETKNKAIVLKRYQGQLSYLILKYAEGNKHLTDELGRLNYIGEDIEKIINGINGNTQAIAKPHRRSGVRYYGGFALNVAKTGFDGDGDFVGSAKYINYAPRLDFGVDVFQNPNVQQLIFRLQVSLSYVNDKNTSSIYGYKPAERTENYSFNQYNATLTPQIIFNIYNKDALKFYVGAGLSINFSAYSNNKHYYTGTSSNFDIDPYELEKVWANFPLQTGVVFNKRIEAFFTYTGPTAFSNYTMFSISSEIYSAGIHLLLK